MKKVFLIEDDLTMSRLLKTLLELEGLNVQTFTAGKTQEDIIIEMLEFNPDVILVDVHLRNMDGISLTKDFRNHSGLSSTPILMTSGINMRDECILAGANDFILKPFMPGELIMKIKKVSDE